MLDLHLLRKQISLNFCQNLLLFAFVKKPSFSLLFNLSQAQYLIVAFGTTITINAVASTTTTAAATTAIITTTSNTLEATYYHHYYLES